MTLAPGTYDDVYPDPGTWTQQRFAPMRNWVCVLGGEGLRGGGVDNGLHRTPQGRDIRPTTHEETRGKLGRRT